MQRLRHMLGLTAVMLAVACTDQGPVIPGPGVQRVTISPASVVLRPTDTLRVVATAWNAAGDSVSGLPVTWTSSRPGVVNVNGQGVLTARQAGEATITASIDGQPGTLTVTVQAAAPVVTTVAVTPGTAGLVPGGTVTLMATALDASGAVLPGRPFAWSSSDTLVATVANGVVTARAEGQTHITASTGGVAGQAVVVVADETVADSTVRWVFLDPVAMSLEIGSSRQITVTALRENGEPVTDLPVTWTVQYPELASVDDAGMVTARHPGRTTVTAVVGGRAAWAEVTVTPAPTWDIVYTAAWMGLEHLLRVDAADPMAEPVALLPQVVWSRDAAVSPDGQWIAFVAPDSTWGSTIWIASRYGQVLGAVTSGPGLNDQPTWSPDGTRIAFRRRYRYRDSDIWVVNTNGSGAVNLTTDMPTDERYPSWSPSVAGTSRITFASAAGSTSAIWSMLPTGGDRRQLTEYAALGDDQPAWSPDGQQVVFHRAVPFGPARLWIMSLNGNNVRPLVSLGGNQTEPAWSPDGKWIAFVSNHEGVQSIYAVRPNGTDVRLITRDGRVASRPAWLRQ